MKSHPYFEPQSLPLSVDLQARDAFFAHYISSKCWDFLKQYYYPADSPEYLTLAIEAVSLAYLWHQVYSDAALTIAREKYVLALRMTNKALKSSREATKDTTLMAPLLLDLFEKITDSQPSNNKSWTSHVNGALALVKYRGFAYFEDPSRFTILVRISLHYIVGCVATGSPVPDMLHAIQAFIGQRLRAQDPMARLSDLMIQYASLRNKLESSSFSTDEYVGLSEELDRKIQALDLELPPDWQYSTVLLDQKSDRAFELHFHSYSNPRVCQARNILRVVRILLNETLIKHHRAAPTNDTCSALLGVVNANIDLLAGEICASVPQYIDCDDAARHRLVEWSKFPDLNSDGFVNHDSGGSTHLHTPHHQLDCYSLIFPLYVAGRSDAVPNVRPWIIKQLHYMSSHFFIRNAETIAQLLERETDVCPWEVYAMLGSYAFAS